MAVSADIEVFGVRDALRELGQLDRKTKFKVINKVKAAGKPMLDKARENYPNDPVLTKDGQVTWRPTGRLGYSKREADKGVQLQVGGRAFGNAYAIVTIIQKNPGAAMFDIAGLNNGASGKGGPRGDAFIQKLNDEYGRAQRGMWRNIVEIRALAANSMTDALNEVMAEVNRKLVITKEAA